MRISEDRLSALAESPGSATLWEVRIMRLEILAARAEIGQLTAERDSESRWAKEYLARAENAERELARVQAVVEAARLQTIAWPAAEREFDSRAVFDETGEDFDWWMDATGNTEDAIRALDATRAEKKT